MDREELLHTPAKNQWSQIGVKNHHGINTPLFSILSKKSGGIGEFLDLKLLIDWVKSIHFDTIQLLPLYETGYVKSPYSPISSNALNTIYLHLPALPELMTHRDLREEVNSLRQFSKLERVPYQKVKKLKELITKQYFEREKEKILLMKEYNDFINSQKWLESYARFVALKEHYHWAPFREWNGDDIKGIENEIHYHKAMQFFAFEQLSEVKRYADQKNVFLKGDIPILICPESADVWSFPEIFITDLTAGAPPDMYCDEGQNWGFPLYDFRGLENQDFQYWKNRLASASQFFHMYRVDHIVGLFRIWAIPRGHKAVDGHFLPEDRSKWVPQGEKMLKLLLDSSPLLPLGEDLGTIPPEARTTMEKMGIPGTKVIRWERKWHEDCQFIPYNEYPKASMTTVSTHDSEPLQLWWEKQPNEAKDFAKCYGWQYSPKLSKDHLEKILYDSHHTSSLFHINLLQEYLGLFPELTHEDLTKERINNPAEDTPLNWTYRYKPFLEEIVSHEGLHDAMKKMVT